MGPTRFIITSLAGAGLPVSAFLAQAPASLAIAALILGAALPLVLPLVALLAEFRDRRRREEFWLQWQAAEGELALELAETGLHHAPAPPPGTDDHLTVKPTPVEPQHTAPPRS